ncbi:MAG: dihydroxy-acid dehydratase [Firmicutes bacterium]|nr:dihydroxy-acid dehydratase [Bacillota bacterium]
MAENFNEKALKNLGYIEEDFKKPLVGIIYHTSQIRTTSSNLSAIIENVQAGVISNGGNAIVLACPSLGGGILSGGRYQMPAREIIADVVESYCIENGFDALVLIGDDNNLGAGLIMGAARLNLPCAYISCKSGKIASIGEVLGISLLGNGTYRSFSSERLSLATKTGKAVMDAFKKQLTIRQIITPDALKNALRFNLSILSSVTVLVSLFAIAYELDINEKDFGPNMLNQVSDITPTLMLYCENFWEKFDRAGKVAAALKELNLACGLANTKNILGQGLLDSVKAAENLDEDFIRTKSKAYAPNSSIVLVKGNLAESGAYVKRLGFSKERLTFSGPAKVFDGEERAQYAINSGQIKQGDIMIIKFEGALNTGLREMDFYYALKKANLKDIVIITDGRIKGDLDCLTISCCSPEGLKGGYIGLVQSGDIIEFNIPRFSFSAKVSSKDLEKRIKTTNFPDKLNKGFLRRYAESVQESVKGGYIK